MAAVTYLSQILNGMMMLAMIFQTVTRGMASSRRLKEVLYSDTPIQDGAGSTQQTGGSIVFSGVSFAYPDHSAEILHDISLRVDPGETLAVIGETGSGKSSLVNLIPRFYDVTAGQVTVDGLDVREYPLDMLREKIAVVLQKSELFSTTIRENITVGSRDADEADIVRAAKAAQADDFIRQQPQGYDTPVAESGMSLSGGQRQRIAISRALVKARHAEILILDDSTSALDFRTEAALQEALRKEYAAMTKIIIAQRISSVQHADRIAVLSGGTVADCGTHTELLERCPLYQEIYRSQLKKEAGSHGA